MNNKKNVKQVIPGIFCIEDIGCAPDETEGFSYRVALYHDRACITVSFNCAEYDPDLKAGEFVSVHWLSAMQSEHGAIRVAGLTALSTAGKYRGSKTFNPFQVVPHSSSVDRHLINCARDLWDISSKELRQLLFATVLARADISKRRHSHGMAAREGRLVESSIVK